MAAAVLRLIDVFPKPRRNNSGSLGSQPANGKR